jgi:CRISPR-associated exonuclease Cas4
MASKSWSTSNGSAGAVLEGCDHYEEDFIPLSALQHFLYCPRQCALIHVEGQWSENLYTAEGQILHSRTDEYRSEQRRGVRTVSGIPIRSRELGVTGKTDVVEFHADEKGREIIFPVEYKRGKPKKHEADEVQLCAQALCLEEMLDAEISEGALFYGSNRRRHGVAFGRSLRELTKDTAYRTRALIASGTTPPPSYSDKLCSQCSLLTVCNPKPLSSVRSVKDWLKGQIEE